jgi:ABC-2 type transport system ATP-binding protein
MDEAEHLADRIAVIADGRIVARGTPGTLGGRDRMAATIRFTLPAGRLPGELPPPLAALAERGPAGAVTLRSATRADLRSLAEWACPRGLDLPDLDVRRPTLEDVYLALTDSRRDGQR